MADLLATIAATANVGSPVVTSDDPHLASVVLLAHMDGEHDSKAFVDSSPKLRALTTSGAAKLTTADKKFGTASGIFDGSASCYVRGIASTDFAFGTGDFTVEFFARKTANGPSGYDTVCGTDTSAGSAVNGWFVELSTSRGFVLAVNGAAPLVNAATGTINDDTWHHWAISRNSGTGRMYRDGTLLQTAAMAQNFVANGAFQIGAVGPGGDLRFNGKLDNLRITKGVGRYPAAFTAPVADFPDTFDTTWTGPTLSVPIPLASAIAAQTALAGALTTQIALQANVTAQTSVAGYLSLQALLQANVISVATLTAALVGAAAELAADIAGAASVEAALTTGIALAGTISASAAVDGELVDANTLLRAAVQGSAGVAADLTTAISMAANLIASAQASARLWEIILADLPDDWLLYVLIEPDERAILRLPDEHTVFMPADDLTVVCLDGAQVLEAAR